MLGWAGTVWADLDLSPLLHTAQAMPEWTFVLLGRRAENPFLPRLGRLPNVVLAGPCPLSQVPEWLYRCDVLMNFLRTDDPCDDIVSPRLYEYLCTGKPVVSMLWPDQVEPFPDVVYGAQDPQSFLTCCRHALEEAPGFVSQRRRDRAREAAWPRRAGQVARILETAGLL